VYVKTETCDYSYPPEYWGGISERAKNLIDSLLTLDLSKRLTARQALQHPWIAVRVFGGPLSGSLSLSHSLTAHSFPVF